MSLAPKRALSLVSLLLFFVLAGSAASAQTVFRDRAAFEAAAQNLRTINFEGEPQTRSGALAYDVDGIRFLSSFGLTVEAAPGSTDKRLVALSIGEITRLTVYLPPGTTAVGLDQFARPMNVGGVTMTAGDSSNFIGFVSDSPITELVIMLDAPEPTPNAVIDNLTFGQRRAGNDPPKPLLLTDAPTGRAAAFESVGLTAEPFDVTTPPTRNLSIDARTRVTLLVAGLSFNPATDDLSFVTARAVDSQHRVYDLPVEAVGGVKNLSWLAQVTVRLPPGISGAGDVSVTVTVRGVESNQVTLRVN
ncbi:MAG TPA: hypothetical protein VN282_14855 [Pyrinomonadaceae bacterium]|nr:hypothetical protein [Pyrinomonadaceae bacterium]